MVRKSRMEGRRRKRETRSKDSLGGAQMNVNHFELKKTALLFFDILNGYVSEPERGKPRVLKPWIQNAVRLSKAGRAAGLPIFFARAITARTMRRQRCFSPIPITRSRRGRMVKSRRQRCT